MNTIPLETLRAYGRKYRDAIGGRLIADHAKDTSDAELERILAPCVCGHWLVPVAMQLRDDGIDLLGQTP
jgi:hypothetical protein